jgi:hypothetical protein
MDAAGAVYSTNLRELVPASLFWITAMQASFLRWFVAPLFVALLGFTGCGSDEPFDYVKISGTVKYEDGTLIQADAIEVTFYPQAPPKDPKTHPRPGTAIVNVADGTFTNVTSHKPNDGVVPGEQKVTVQTFDQNHEPTNVLPAEYNSVNTTPLSVDTATSKKFDIVVKKK